MKIKKQENLMLKMGDYRAAMLIRIAFLQGSTFFSLVVFLLTGDLIFMGAAAITALYFITLKPTADKISSDLELDPSEKFRIDNTDEVIAEFETNSYR